MQRVTQSWDRKQMPGNSWKSWGPKYGYNPETHGFLTSLGFEDSSSEHDAVPSFWHEELRLKLSIDSVEDSQRDGMFPLSLVEMSQSRDRILDIIWMDSWMEMAEYLREIAASHPS